MHGGYPELRVDGAPFFVHGATFDYFRIPRDLWDSSLDRYRELGINTIDVAIPWNWHEPREGEFDFDGHTNPRRDLRALLHMIAEKRFHLIVRTAPVGVAHWRHGGYPEWLLERAGGGMAAADRAAGRLPPLAEEESHDAESAARTWMSSTAHMTALRTWLTALARELAPYGPMRKIRISEPGEKGDGAHSVEIDGPLLFVQLDESPGLDSSSGCSQFWTYIGAMQKILQAGSVDSPYLVNPVTAGAAPPCSPPVGTSVFFTGRWNLNSRLARDGPPGLAASGKVTPTDAAAAVSLVQSLQAQHGFVSIISDFQPGTFAPADDLHPPAIAPSNTLLASRLILAQGMQGFEYAPLQDTLTPAGYDVPEANRYYRWDAALSLSGRRQPQAVGVTRNGQFAAAWGTFLAASHKRADFALVDVRTIWPKGSTDPGRASKTLEQIERAAGVSGLSFDLVDPNLQTLDVLLRYATVFLLRPDDADPAFELSGDAQSRLVEYVRQGGALVCVPRRPSGATLEQLWKDAPPASGGESSPLAPTWRFGEGRVIEWDRDFYSWVSLTSDPSEDRERPAAAQATSSLHQALTQAGTRPAILRQGFDLLVTERVSHAGTHILGRRPPHCAREEAGRDVFGSLCNRGLLSVTNLNYGAAVQEQLQVLSSRAGIRGPDDEYLALDVRVPAHDSLLLPVHAPLCGEDPKEKCEDEVVIAGAELLRAERDAKTLLLAFYTPARASILLHLESQPTKISIGDINLEGKWMPDTHLLEINLPRGAAPEYLREVAIHLRYTPHVPARPDPGKRPHRNFDSSVADAVPLPLGEDVSLPSFPPLVLLGPERKGTLLYQAENHDDSGRDVSVKIEGEIRGSGRLMLDPNEFRQELINVSPASSMLPGTAEGSKAPPRSDTDGLYVSQLSARSGRFERKTPIHFVSVGPDAPMLYQFDFDRDGAKEWVLENARLRLIVSPADGGRVLAFVDKSTSTDFATPVGGLRDLLVVQAAPARTAAGSDVTFNRSYIAEKVEKEKEPAIRLRYHVPEIAGGAVIEKTLWLEGKDTVDAEYRVSLSGSSSGTTAFVVMNSVPVVPGGDRGTRFCWESPGAHAEAAPAAPVASSETNDVTCEPFAPGGNPIVPPAGVKRLEVRTPGHPKLILAWDEGILRIEPKAFSALLKLEFPALTPGAEPARYNLRYTVAPAD